MKVKSKLFNRTFSIICLFFFVGGLAAIGASTYFVVNLYHENQRLNEVKQNLIDHSTTNKEHDELHFDDYYSVYVENGYAIYDSDGSLIFFTNNK